MADTFPSQPKLSTIQRKVQRAVGWNKGFPGAQPVSMDRKNIGLLAEKPYMVSWKADGTRFWYYYWTWDALSLHTWIIVLALGTWCLLMEKTRCISLTETTVSSRYSIPTYFFGALLSFRWLAWHSYIGKISTSIYRTLYLMERWWVFLILFVLLKLCAQVIDVVNGEKFPRFLIYDIVRYEGNEVSMEWGNIVSLLPPPKQGEERTLTNIALGPTALGQY